MGCSSSAQTKVKEYGQQSPKSPDANGVPQCEDSLPITNKNDTVLDQTKLEAMKEVEFGSSGKKSNEDLPKEDPDALIQGTANAALSTCHRVDPEGTEPQLMAPDEKFNRNQSLLLGLLEAGGLQPSGLVSNPQAASEAAGSSPLESVQEKKPEPAESSGSGTPESTAEENQSLVTEIVKELLMDEEEQLTEVTVPGETGEKMKTEMHHEIRGASETKEEIGEATMATEITDYLEVKQIKAKINFKKDVKKGKEKQLMKKNDPWFLAGVHGFWLDILIDYSVNINIPV